MKLKTFAALLIPALSFAPASAIDIPLPGEMEITFSSVRTGSDLGWDAEIDEAEKVYYFFEGDREAGVVDCGHATPFFGNRHEETAYEFDSKEDCEVFAALILGYLSVPSLYGTSRVGVKVNRLTADVVRVRFLSDPRPSPSDSGERPENGGAPGPHRYGGSGTGAQ